MLNVVSAADAERIIREHLPIVDQTEKRALLDAVGLVCAEDIFSKENIPPFDRSTVDGYAVKASDTYGCSSSLPAMLQLDSEILMGEAAQIPLLPGTCQKIPTGGMLPPGSDAVVMFEYCEDYNDGVIYVGKPCAVYENTTRKGDDVADGDVVSRKGEVITSRSVGQLASLGVAEITVMKKLRVGIISTGDEIVPYYQQPPVGCVRDINSPILSAVLETIGVQTVVYPIVKDVVSSLRDTVLRAVSENDMVLLSGGSSAGDKDAANAVLSELGEVYFHGIAIKPGKPTLFANIYNKPVFALPGHPLAATLMCHLFVVPAIAYVLSSSYKSLFVFARAAINIPSDHGREEVIPVFISEQDDGFCAEPIFAKSGVISVLHKADGYIRIDRDREGINKGDIVKVYLFARQI